MRDTDAPLILDASAAARMLRSHWRLLALGAATGFTLGVIVAFLASPRFSGRAMVLIRTAVAPTSALARKAAGPLAELLPSGLAGSDEELSTELALLSSRATIGAVVDSLRLQVIPKSPGRIPALDIVDSLRIPDRFRPRTLELAPGPNKVEGGVVFARRKARVRLVDREDAIDEVAEHLAISKAGGNAVEVRYTGRDSVSAAAVPNLLSAVYILRRRTVDRGLNQRRLEFLSSKADSVRWALESSADNAARVAERTDATTDPEITGRAFAERMGLLEARISELRASERTLDSLLEGVRARRIDARSLAGFPDLLRSPAVNDIVGQVARVEMERNVLLGRNAPTAPQVVALGRARDSLVGQLIPLASTYRESLVRQRVSLERDRDLVRAQAARLPRQAASSFKEKSDLARLAQLDVGMGAQVLEARLAALLEGGDVRLVDAAVAPRRPDFPRPAHMVLAGLLGGLLLGAALAILRHSPADTVSGDTPR